VKTWRQRKVSTFWLLPITGVLFFNHFVHLTGPAVVALITIFAAAIAADAARDSA
jgi:hypothetical protein